MRRFSFFCFFCFFLFSCQDERYNSQVVLQRKYWQTKEIHLSTNKAIVTLQVKKSALVQRKKLVMGQNWVNAEAVASVSAVLFGSTPSFTNIGFDSLRIVVDNDDKSEEIYSYSIDDLIMVNNHIDISSKFIKAGQTRNLELLKPFFSKDITESTPDSAFKGMVDQIFPGVKVKQIELVGFKIANQLSSEYYNVSYSNKIVQTYILTYSINGKLILGISLP